MRHIALILALALASPLMASLPSVAVAAKGDGAHPAVTQLSANTFRIEKATFHAYTRDLKKASNLAHAVPSRGRRGVNGWTLSSIRKGSLVHACGLHNGDRVTRINGKALKGMPGVALTLKSLQNAKNYTVKVVRRDGRKVTLKYQVR